MTKIQMSKNEVIIRYFNAILHFWDTSVSEDKSIHQNCGFKQDLNDNSHNSRQDLAKKRRTAHTFICKELFLLSNAV